MKQINYIGNSKLISRIVHLLNRKAPLPLDGQGDAEWGTSGQVLTTDGQGNTYWGEGGGGGDVTDVEVNGTSVVNAQGVAEVSVPTATSDLNNDSGFIDGTGLSTALSDYTPTSSLATVATSGDYDDLTNKPTIPAAQVQSDWSQADNTHVDYIKNKPTIPTALADLSEDTTHRVVTDTEKTTWNGKVSDNPTFTEAATRANIASGESFATILGKIKKFFTDLKTVAFTGAYSDLSGLPTIVNAHVIENPTGTDMAQRANLQFADAHLTDDSVNGRTKAENIKAVDSTGWSNATEDGLYDVDDGGNYVPITGNEIGYDANTSLNQKIDAVDAKTANVAYSNVNNKFSTNQNFDSKSGTAGVAGATNIVVGNNKDVSQDQNSIGQLLLFGEGTNYTNINAPNSTADRTISCPDADGTFALKEINNYFSSSQTIDNKAGTTTTVGVSSLALGNATAEGNDKNAKGRLLLYGKGTRYATLMATDVTANRMFELPDASGTIALTSDLVQYEEVTGTTTGTGALGLPSKFAEASGQTKVVSITLVDQNGLAIWRKDGYAQCFNANLVALASTSVKVRVFYFNA